MKKVLLGEFGFKIPLASFEKGVLPPFVKEGWGGFYVKCLRSYDFLLNIFIYG
jgi:hypothetical protein